jgi:hypothetical protein
MPAMCPCPQILKMENASLPNTKEDETCSFLNFKKEIIKCAI